MRKHITILTISLIIGLIGCGPRKKLNNSFDQIVYFNGINEFEAKTIAEMELTHSSFKAYYKKTKTVIRKDKYARQYPQFYFIDFSLELLFDAPSYLIVIDKSNGDIIFANEYFPKKIKNLDWVIERLKKYGKIESAPDDTPSPENHL